MGSNQTIGGGAGGAQGNTWAIDPAGNANLANVKVADLQATTATITTLTAPTQAVTTLTATTGTITTGTVTTLTSTTGTVTTLGSTTGTITTLAATTATAATLGLSGALTFSTANAGVILKQGANGLCGTFTANGTTPVSVASTAIAITDCIIISLNTAGGTVGVQPHVATITAGTGFTVVCTASDSSIYNWAAIRNAA